MFQFLVHFELMFVYSGHSVLPTPCVEETDCPFSIVFSWRLHRRSVDHMGGFISGLLAMFSWTSRIQATKTKNKRVGLHQTKKLLHIKVGSQRSGKAACGTGENICKLRISDNELIAKISKELLLYLISKNKQIN